MAVLTTEGTVDDVNERIKTQVAMVTFNVRIFKLVSRVSASYCHDKSFLTLFITKGFILFCSFSGRITVTSCMMKCTFITETFLVLGVYLL